jgi:hypothetical protein
LNSLLFLESSEPQTQRVKFRVKMGHFVWLMSGGWGASSIFVRKKKLTRWTRYFRLQNGRPTKYRHHLRKAPGKDIPPGQEHGCELL